MRVKTQRKVASIISTLVLLLYRDMSTNNSALLMKRLHYALEGGGDQNIIDCSQYVIDDDYYTIRNFWNRM